MRVFENREELRAAMALPADTAGSFRFLAHYGPAGFRCATCGQAVAFPLTGGGTGYGTDNENRMHCYACCTARDREEMKTAARFCGYLSSDGRYFTSWPGGILGTVTAESTSRTGWHGSRITHVQIRDTHGNYWHGKGAGRGMFLRIKRCTLPRAHGPQKTVTVDHYVPHGTHGPAVADFWHRGRLVCSVAPATRADVSIKLAAIAQSHGFTHARQSGRVSRIA